MNDKSDYKIEWGDPPPATRGGTSGQLYVALEQIKERPGEWAKVVASNSRSGASSILTGIKKQKRRIPEGQYEFQVRTDGTTMTSTLYARYIGSEEDVDVDDVDIPELITTETKTTEVN